MHARARAPVFGEIESFAGWGSNTGKVSRREDDESGRACRGGGGGRGSRAGTLRGIPWRGGAGARAVGTWSLLGTGEERAAHLSRALRPTVSFRRAGGGVAGVARLGKIGTLP